MKPRLGSSPSTTVNLTVPDRRSRRYLTGKEIERLMDCARKHSRHGHRDATMVLVAYRHGLRASEICDLQWHQIELAEGRMHVHRAKRGIPSVHPIRGDEMRALRKLRREHSADAYVFVSEPGGPEPHRLPSAYPAPRGSRQDAFLDPSAHAAPCLRIQACERWTRYPSFTALSWASEYPAHDSLHRISGGSLQRFLAKLGGRFRLLSRGRASWCRMAKSHAAADAAITWNGLPMLPPRPPKPPPPRPPRPPPPPPAA